MKMFLSAILLLVVGSAAAVDIGMIDNQSSEDATLRVRMFAHQEPTSFVIKAGTKAPNINFPGAATITIRKGVNSVKTDLSDKRYDLVVITKDFDIKAGSQKQSSAEAPKAAAVFV